MVKSIFISDLYGKKINKEYRFDEHINIVTGINGAGKTTFIKLVWYLISGNIERALEEIDFSYINLVHSMFTIEIERKNYDNSEINTIVTLETSRERNELKMLTKQRSGNNSFKEYYKKINDMNFAVLEYSKVSLFFPTFRRIEGGFFINEHISSYSYDKRTTNNQSGELTKLVTDIGNDLTVYNHKLIASFSTDDIDELMKNEYLKISKKSLELNNEAMNKIKRIVTQNNQLTEEITKEKINEKNRLFNYILELITDVDKKQKNNESPINELGNFINLLYHYKGIQFSDNITVGDSNDALVANKLSAGEKQMLSFLCYNAFLSNGIIFIDEPELSLHVDWQRILIKTMIKQNASNQLIFATHSPFIYSQYEKYEIVIDENKGDSNGKDNNLRRNS